MRNDFITIYSFGYSGWGNHTPELLELIDHAERGWKPPVFVDVRIRRTARAKGFCGSAFEELLGQQRYVWMKELGNPYILGRDPEEPSPHKIDRPSFVKKLLNRAKEEHSQKRRVIFFCYCRDPMPEYCDCPRNSPQDTCGYHCHRTEIQFLLVKKARQSGMPICVVEWPGGKPRTESLTVPLKTLNAVWNGKQKRIPLGLRFDASLCRLPWYSTVNLLADDGSDSMSILTGPARYSTNGWFLEAYDQDEVGSSRLAKAATKYRRHYGYGPKFSFPTPGM